MGPTCAIKYIKKSEALQSNSTLLNLIHDRLLQLNFTI